MVLEGATERPPVFCADCSTPHHQDCFEYGGRCAIYGCGGVRYTKDGRAVAELRTGGARAGKPPKRPARRMILDLVTPLESATSTATLLLFLAAFVTFLAVSDRKHPATFDFQVPAVLLMCACVAAAVARSTDCYYVLDQAVQMVMYHRRFLGVTRLYEISPFRAISAVELSERRRWHAATKHSKGYFYTEVKLELVDSRGERLLVSDLVEARERPERAEVEQRGRDAAALLGCHYRERRYKYDPWHDGAGPAAMGVPAVFILTLPLLGPGALAAAACYAFFMWPRIAGLFGTDDER